MQEGGDGLLCTQSWGLSHVLLVLPRHAEGLKKHGMPEPLRDRTCEVLPGPESQPQRPNTEQKIKECFSLFGLLCVSLLIYYSILFYSILFYSILFYSILARHNLDQSLEETRFSREWLTHGVGFRSFVETRGALVSWWGKGWGAGIHSFGLGQLTSSKVASQLL